MGQEPRNLYEEIRVMITELLTLYQDYNKVNMLDAVLTGEMEKLANKCKTYSTNYIQQNEADPSKLIPYQKHISALSKLMPALSMCIKEHNDRIQASLPRLNELTKALSEVELLMKKGFITLPIEELALFHQKESLRLKGLKEALPVIEKEHQVMRRRFDAISSELEKFDPVAEE